MRRFAALFLVMIMSISLASCSDMDILQIINKGIAAKDVNQIHKVVLDDGTVSTLIHTSDGIPVSAVAELPDGTVIEHKYDENGSRYNSVDKS